MKFVIDIDNDKFEELKKAFHIYDGEDYTDEDCIKELFIFEYDRYQICDIRDGINVEKEEIEIETCCVCGGDCEMNTEYDGSAICKDKNCSVHNEGK